MRSCFLFGQFDRHFFLKICHGKMANPKELQFLEFSYRSIDKRNWPLKEDAAKKLPALTANDHLPPFFNVETFS